MGKRMKPWRLEVHLRGLAKGGLDLCFLQASSDTNRMAAAIINGERLGALWHTFSDIEDPAAFMGEVREVLKEAKAYFDRIPECTNSDGHPEPTEEMKVGSGIDALLDRMGRE